jgi:hypothetical protein
MSGSDHQRGRPYRGMGQPRRRGERLVSLGGGAAGLPSVTDAQLAALLYVAHRSGRVDEVELRRDTLSALLRVGLVIGRGAYEVELTPLGLRVLVCVAPRLLEPQREEQSRRPQRRAS